MIVKIRFRSCLMDYQICSIISIEENSKTNLRQNTKNIKDSNIAEILTKNLNIWICIIFYYLNIEHLLYI